MRSKLLYILTIFVLCFELKAQDAQFTQFYASPLYLNPAFTGLTYEHRFTATYRNQWPNNNTGFRTYMATYDYNLSELNSGIGFFAMRDNAGIVSRLSTTVFGANYAYRIKINRYSEARAAISLAMGQEKIDNSNLTFNDQLVTGSSVSLDGGSLQKAVYPDLGIGGLYNSRNFWFGAAAKHLNRPDISLTGNPNNLPVYFTAHGGYRYSLSDSRPGKTKMDEYLNISANYRHQGKNDQMDIGAYYFKSIVNVGLWYRGLPLKHYQSGIPNNESVALLIGIDINDKGLRVGYSYDFTVSRLKLANTKGAHEIALVYEIAKKSKRSGKHVLISYPKF